jgi:hypothetical protein
MTKPVEDDLKEAFKRLADVSAGSARFRQQSEAMRKTYARCEFFSP